MVRVGEKEEKLLKTALEAIENACVLWRFRLVPLRLRRMVESMAVVMLKAGFPDLAFALKDVQSTMLFCMVIGKLRR
jgi:hypothetical protein